MIFKVIYTIIIFIICIVAYKILKEKEHSLGYIVVTGILTTIIGNLLIPSDISIFDIFSHFITTQKNIESSSNDIEDVIPKIELGLKSLDLLVSDEYILEITASPNDVYVNLKSNNPEIATVDSNGNIKAINEGNTIITATIIYKDIEYADTCNVTVNNPVIILNPSYSIYTGETYNLSVATIPTNVNIIWNSNNTEIVTVNDNGEIEGISEGTATIIATMVYNNINYSANCIVTVESQPDEYNDNSNNNEQNKDDIKSEIQETVGEEVISNSDLQESEINSVSLSDIYWYKSEKAYKDESATTMRGKQWSDCIRFGSSNLNADGCAIIKVDFDEKYSRFTAEIAPQEGFDESEEVIVYIYGFCNGEQTFVEEYSINYDTKSIPVDIDITGIDEFCIEKVGNYNMGRIAGQFINDYTGMGVLMRDATLYK